MAVTGLARHFLRMPVIINAASRSPGGLSGLKGSSRMWERALKPIDDVGRKARIHPSVSTHLATDATLSTTKNQVLVRTGFANEGFSTAKLPTRELAQSRFERNSVRFNNLVAGRQRKLAEGNVSPALQRRIKKDNAARVERQARQLAGGNYVRARSEAASAAATRNMARNKELNAQLQAADRASKARFAGFVALQTIPLGIIGAASVKRDRFQQYGDLKETWTQVDPRSGKVVTKHRSAEAKSKFQNARNRRDDF